MAIPEGKHDFNKKHKMKSCGVDQCFPTFQHQRTISPKKHTSCLPQVFNPYFYGIDGIRITEEGI